MNAPTPLSRMPVHRIASELDLPRLLLLGEIHRPPAGEWPCIFVHDTDHPFDALLVTDAVGAARAEAVLRRRRGWQAPVADVSGSRLWIADVGGLGSASIPAMRDAVEGLLAILARLYTLPAPVVDADDPETALLARAYSRGGRLQPVYDGNAPELVRLPAAGLLDETAALAERLAEDGWFERGFFDRLHVCGNCGSSRLNVREQCTVCHSADVFEESLVHHFRCAHQAAERQFRQDNALVCPKCRRTLRHFGVDYDRPGKVTVCRGCGHVDMEPAVGFVCVDCGVRHPGEALPTRDWYAYALTDMAKRRLLSGDLRTLRSGGPAEAHIFHTLARHWMQIQSRYGRPATVLRLAFTRAAELQVSVGPRAVTDAKRQAVEIVRNELRETDFMIEAAEGMLIVLPETDAALVDVPRSRLLTRLADALALDLGVEIRAIPPAELLSDGVPPPVPVR